MKRRQTKKELQKALKEAQTLDVQTAWDTVADHLEKEHQIGAFVDRVNSQVEGRWALRPFGMRADAPRIVSTKKYQ